MDLKRRKVPKLRFPGFIDEWEQRKVTDVAKVFIGLVTSMTENYRDAGTLLIRNSDIKEFKFDFSSTPIYLEESFAERNKGRRFELGDVVTVHTGDIGTSAVVSKHEVGAIGFATINTRPKKEIIDSNFLATFFNTNKHKNYALKMSTGDGRSNYNLKDFNKLEVPVPLLDEQHKVSKLIYDLEKTITLHQQKLNSISMLKKALLQKLFPKKGETYPELRFPGFADAWEQRKLGDLGKVAMNKRVFKEQTSSEGDIPFFKIGTFGGEPDAFISRELFEELKSKFSYPKIGDLLISASGSIGRIVEYQGEEAYYQDSNIVWLEHDERLDNSFLKQFYQQVKWFGLEGSTIQRLYNKNILSTNISLPNCEEQKNIGKLLEKLDKTITLHQRKLEHLKLLKKALLQQLFV